MDGKTFEDLAFEVISRVSPVKLPRDNIPFDSVRAIVLNEISYGKRKHLPIDVNRKRIEFNKRSIEFDDMDEMTSSESSSTLANMEDDTTFSNFNETANNDLESNSQMSSLRTFSEKCLETKATNCNNPIQHIASAPSLSSLATFSGDKKKVLSYRERRLTEMRMARIKSYRGDGEVHELKCEENTLFAHFDEYYWKLINDSSMSTPCAYFRIIDSLDLYFRARTWDNNCNKLCCEFLRNSVYKSCQEISNAHDAKDSNDEIRVKELMIQVFIGLHVFGSNFEQNFLDDTINKLRLIYITDDPQTMRAFLEEPVTDIFVDQMAESIANIYDELCVTLPADLSHFDNGFKILQIEDNQVGKRRNGNANKLEELLAETSFDVGTIEKKPTFEQKKGTKRKNETEKDYPSSIKKKISEKEKEIKKCFVEDTPDEKYNNRVKTEIEEEIDEVVQQTPMAKLRMAANKSGRRCSKRLSDMVKLSGERCQLPRKARENMEKMLEQAKSATPLRSAKRTPKNVLFSNNSPSPLFSSTRSSRTSLDSRFSTCSSAVSVSTPIARKFSLRSNGSNETNGNLTPKKQNGHTENIHERNKVKIKREIIEDDEKDDDNDDDDEDLDYKFSAIKNGSSKEKQWSDRKLRSQLGLTRDDLNRYRIAMLQTGVKKQEQESTNNGDKKNWDNMQVNRAGRVKGEGGGDGGAPMFGIKRRSIDTFMCHVLLNDSNPDMSFDWSKVNFDIFDKKPRTRSVQTLFTKPQKLLESLKRNFLESKSSPSSSAKKIKLISASPNGSLKKRNSFKVTPTKKVKKEELEPIKITQSVDCFELNDFGLESEASD